MQPSTVYEVRGRRLLRCVLSPFSDGVALAVCLSSGILLVVGGWASVGAATFLAVFGLRTYFLGLQADTDGLVVANRFVRHHIPWKDVRGIWVPGRSASALFPTVRIERRHSVWFSISIYATLGMSREQRHAVTVDLAKLARQNGYRIVHGSEAEVEDELEAERTEGG